MLYMQGAKGERGERERERERERIKLLCTCNGVSDLSSIVEQAELVSVNGFTSLIIQHLMAVVHGGERGEERKEGGEEGKGEKGKRERGGMKRKGRKKEWRKGDRR